MKAIFAIGGPEEADKSSETSQTMPLFKAAVVEKANTNEIVDSSSSSDSLSVTSGALRVSTEDAADPNNDTISVYEVKQGDTLATVAKLFGVSKNTIMWANNLKSENLTPGTTIVILPITGIKHTVKKGDTVDSIAKKYKADADDISVYNGISKNKELAVGDVVIVPDGEAALAPAPSTKGKPKGGSKSPSYLKTTPAGFLVRPLAGGIKTQGIHGHNAVDIGTPVGTSIVAAASGNVIVSKSSGYNGGYGQMVIIDHGNGIQTVYGHLSAVYVSAGIVVQQGQVIGASGNTGHSTGPHLHFEVRGAANPF
ncbi:MAG: peptidase family protein [Candidatus Nomurabacteria bacterium]|nr:peptidase family protein [Candidatus Nomurabacteria bacterium]